MPDPVFSSDVILPESEITETILATVVLAHQRPDNLYPDVDIYTGLAGHIIFHRVWIHAYGTTGQHSGH